MRHRRIRRPQTTTELNITAFMNLMVVLVPFLLMTAVFSHLSILELNLPKPEDGAANGKRPAFDLKMVIRKNSISVVNGRRLIKQIPARAGQQNFKLLSQVLVKIKSEYADKQAITILSEADIPYDILVKAMDAARSFYTFKDGNIIEAELFPGISIGDAPKR